MTPSSAFPKLIHLANYIRCEEYFLEHFFAGDVVLTNRNSPSTLREDDYLTIIDRFKIPKKNRSLGYRTIYSIRTETYKSVLKVLAGELRPIYKPLDCVQGFIPGRGVRANASLHLARRFVLCVDIKDFFESINDKMIEFALANHGFSTFASERLSKLVTLDGKLVQGFPSSPIISNIVAVPADERLLKLSGNSVAYSRYADDLYFSSNDKVPSLSEIQSVLEESGFRINEQKTREMKRGSKQYVTGLTVFDDKKPRIPKSIKRNLRLQVHYIKKHGLHNHVLKRLGYNMDEYLHSFEIREEVENEKLRLRMQLTGWIQFLRVY